MARIPKIIRSNAVDQDTWTKIFDWTDNDLNRIEEITVKLSETTTADHFRYNYDGDTTHYKTATLGVTVPLDAKRFYVYVPDVDAQVFEMEILYK